MSNNNGNDPATESPEEGENVVVQYEHLKTTLRAILYEQHSLKQKLRRLQAQHTDLIEQRNALLDNAIDKDHFNFVFSSENEENEEVNLSDDAFELRNSKKNAATSTNNNSQVNELLFEKGGLTELAVSSPAKKKSTYVRSNCTYIEEGGIQCTRKGRSKAVPYCKKHERVVNERKNESLLVGPNNLSETPDEVKKEVTLELEQSQEITEKPAEINTGE